MQYVSEDIVENNETATSLTVYVDDSAPTTTLSIGMPKYALVESVEVNVTRVVDFTLSAIDIGVVPVGVNFTWYWIDGDYYVYSGAFNFSAYGEGTYTLQYGSEDLVENNETATSLTVYVDDSAPTTTLSIGMR